MGFEPTTFCLGSKHSTTELHPHTSILGQTHPNVKLAHPSLTLIWASTIMAAVSLFSLTLEGLKGRDMPEVVLHPASVIAELRKNRISHVVWLPDSETNFMFQQLTAEPDMELIPVCREGETMAIAAGLWLGGARPAVLIQNTGVFESGDSIRGLGLDVKQPLVMLVGYRGWDRHGATRDSAARFIEHILHAWGINYYLVETDDDAPRITEAMEEAERTSRPVAVLVGTEFGT